MGLPDLASTIACSRRVALGALGAGALAFAAFGPRGEKSGADGRVVLDYWEKWTGHEGEAMRRIVDEFNASQSRIFVRYFAMNAIGQKALIAIAGGSPPDIIGLWNFNIPAYAEAGALLALDDLAAESGISREKYAPAVWSLLRHREKLWGIVSTCGSIALYYNRALFREAGLDPDRPPRTIAEFDEYNDRLTRFEGGGAGRSVAASAGSSSSARDIERMGFIHTEPGWWSWLWGYFFGGSLYDPESDRATATDARNVAGYEWVQRYPEKFSPRALVKFQAGLGNYGSAEHPFLLGKVAMTNQGPWLANNIVEFKKDLDYGVAPFPAEASVYDAERPIGLLDADVLVIPRGASHPRESFEFIAYTQRPEVMERLSSLHCKNSPLAHSSDEFFAKHPNRHVRVHDAIAQSERAFVFPRTRVWPAYEDEFRSGLQRIWNLQQPASVALAQIQARAQAELDRAAVQRQRRAGADGGAAR